MKTKWIASREFSASPGRALAAVRRAGRVVVTANGKPRAIMIPTSEESLESDLEELGRPAAARAASAPAISASPVDLLDYARLAPAKMTRMAWEYFNGSAGDELTARWNEEAFGRILLRTRNLVDVSSIDLRVTLLGREMAFPILLAPTAYQRLAHPDGELATARGASASGATMVLSSHATTSLEEVAAATKGPKWFQLYVNPDREFTRALVLRAEAAGYQALVLTVDTPILGMRYREQRVNFTLPKGIERANLRGLSGARGAHRPSGADIYSITLDPKLTWKDVDWLRSITRMPILLKGVMNADDAGRSVDSGAAALIVSNHGGRNIDTVPATMDVLPEIVERVSGSIPVLVDGGIRRGTDVLKALGMGARAVLVGRPCIYGLAVGGADGVADVINILRRELAMAMAMTGLTSIAQVDGSVIWRPARESTPV